MTGDFFSDIAYYNPLNTPYFSVFFLGGGILYAPTCHFMTRSRGLTTPSVYRMDPPGIAKVLQAFNYSAILSAVAQ